MITNISTTIDRLSIGLPKHWGNLSLFPIFRHDHVSTDVVAAVDAIRDGQLRISEAPDATVPTLRAYNGTGRKVFFIAGEVVFGGRQDRCVYDSVVIPPGEVDLPVACVEQGRWSGKMEFEARTAVANRRLRHGSMAGRTTATVDQGRVWDLVEESLAASAIVHPTQSLRPLMERDDRHVRPIVEMGPMPGQCGLAVGAREKVLGVELFASASLLASYWESIVRSYAVERLDVYVGHPSLGRVLRFARTGARTLTTTGDAQLGLRLSGTSPKLAATALVDGDSLLYMSVLAA